MFINKQKFVKKTIYNGDDMKKRKLIYICLIICIFIVALNFFKLSNVKAEGKTLVLVNGLDAKLELSVRNLPYAAICLDSHSSVYDILDAETLVVTKEVVNYFEEALLDE